ncbi:hypothetical protein R1flu_007824 [Riccia fluitans]|uniref:Uncharacterized protein n=1 Tax=Riccia fluitans TaxID=41844 RepID=A0ABD1Z077_9MARC
MVATENMVFNWGTIAKQKLQGLGVPSAVKSEDVYKYYRGANRESGWWSSVLMADAAYSCKQCGVYLNVSSNMLYPPDTYFQAGNRGTLSFMEVDMSKFRKQKENRNTKGELKDGAPTSLG